MDEPGGPDRLTANLLNTFGWILILIGLEPIGQVLIMGGSVYSYPAVGAITLVGVVFIILAHNWPPTRPKIRAFLTPILAPIAVNARWWSLAIILILWISITFQISSLRSDFDMYVVPRSVTKTQADDLRDYLSQRETHAVTIKVNPVDEEAREYAGQLSNAFSQAGWDVKFDTSSRDPNTLNAGLCVHEWGQNSKPNDPKHDARALIQQALQVAHIESPCGGSTGAGNYELFLLVGHRPVAINRTPSPLFRLGRWLMRLG